MLKPDWLKEREKKRNAPAPVTCETCIYFGRFVKWTKHKGKEHCEVRECDIHPKCLNTKYSIRCSDHTKG